MESIYIKETKDYKEVRSRNINKCEKAEKDKLKFLLLFLLLISPFLKCRYEVL